MSSRKMQIPTDANSNPLNRSMGLPLAFTRKVTSKDYWCDLADLSAYAGRVFIGLTAKNPSSSAKIAISFDEENVGDESEGLIVNVQEAIALDGLTFGPGVNDYSLGIKTNKLRVKLAHTLDSGTLSSATITYSGTNVSDGQCVQINGTTYEFSADQSVAAGRVKVDIGASADASWTNLVAAANAYDGNVHLSINTGTNVVTVQSTKGGTDGDGTVVADGATPTGATFSGNTTGGAGGIEFVVNIW